MGNNYLLIPDLFCISLPISESQRAHMGSFPSYQTYQTLYVMNEPLLTTLQTILYGSNIIDFWIVRYNCVGGPSFFRP